MDANMQLTLAGNSPYYGYFPAYSSAQASGFEFYMTGDMRTGTEYDLVSWTSQEAGPYSLLYNEPTFTLATGTSNYGDWLGTLVVSQGGAAFSATSIKLAPVSPNPVAVTVNAAGTTASGGQVTQVLTIPANASYVLQLFPFHPDFDDLTSLTLTPTNSDILFDDFTFGSAVVPPTLAATVTSVIASPSTGDVTTGSLVTLTVTMSGSVTVAGGTPTLSLNDGGSASYDAAKSSTTALVFDYTVQSGQSTTALAVTSLDAGNATIEDASGTPANLSLSGVQTTFSGLEVNQAQPEPDLVANSVSLGSTSLTAGGSTTVSYHIANVGNANAGGSVSKVYLSTSPVINTGDIVVASVNDLSLTPNN
jgi:hypothetical protein